MRSWAAGVGALDASGAVTSIGRAIVRFRGRDALWFLLELEVAQSTGRADGLRLPRAALVALRRAPLWYDDSYPKEMQPPFAWAALQRWAGLGVLVHDGGEGPQDGYSVEEDAQDLVDTVISAEPNPFRALVEALLADERGGVTSTFTGVAAPGGDPSYGRMVAHEVGNIVLPLRTALDRLWRELERTGGPDPARVQDLRERLDRGVQRLGTFAAQAASIADAVEPEEVDLLALAEEAVEATKLERNGRIKVDLAGLGPVRIEGPRQRWVLLFVNLFRNAAQVRDGAGTVWVSSSQAVSGAVDLLVDDDGPGVPEDLRERIFQRGFSARGGDGFGLSDVRLTVQRSGGTVTCLASPRGGTRFHIRLPAGGRS